jgi:hypothetical protein
VASFRFQAASFKFGKRRLVPEIPSTNLQAPEKFQTPSSKPASGRFWLLELGASLNVGCWCLALIKAWRFLI